MRGLGKRALARARFPLGDSTKEEVRAEARAIGLPVAEKPDSQELCFVPGGDHRAVLRERAPGLLRAGSVVDEDGRTLGAHDGAAGFTVGQRRGLGVAAAEPLHVASVDVLSGRVVAAPRRRLLKTRVRVSAVNWVDVDAPTDGRVVEADVAARIRHGQPPAPARLRSLGPDRTEIVFADPVFAPAPGQLLVAYLGDAVLCAGTIDTAE